MPAEAKSTPANKITDLDTNTIEAAGLRLFFELSERWGLNTEQQMTLLGQPGRTTFFKWKKFQGRLPKDTVERLSHIASIHKCLAILFKESGSRDSWIRNPNLHSTFLGMTPLDVMLDGRMIDVLRVRQYLDVQRGG